MVDGLIENIVSFSSHEFDETGLRLRTSEALAGFYSCEIECGWILGTKMQSSTLREVLKSQTDPWTLQEDRSQKQEYECGIVPTQTDEKTCYLLVPQAV